MQKYGVVTEPKNEDGEVKESTLDPLGITKPLRAVLPGLKRIQCPQCASPVILETPDAPRVCPSCGTEPFEPR